MTTKSHWERPLAAKPFTSYRYPGDLGGFIMIGAMDDGDAISEANRSLAHSKAKIEKLEKWNGEKYEKV